MNLIMSGLDLKPLLEDADSAYQVVVTLKKYKEQGYKTISLGYDRINIGQLMRHIVSLSKNGYSYSDIIYELAEKRSYYD